MIDVVVGVNSSEPYEVNSRQEKVAVQTHAKADAARLYLSQRCKVDKLFDLKNGKVGNIEGLSAAVLKADGIRIIARNGIKLVTRTDNLNSSGSRTKAIYGIENLPDAIEKLYEMDSEDRKALGLKAREYVLSEFNHQTTVDLWHDTLTETINTWKEKYEPWECKEI